MLKPLPPQLDTETGLVSFESFLQVSRRDAEMLSAVTYIVAGIQEMFSYMGECSGQASGTQTNSLRRRLTCCVLSKECVYGKFRQMAFRQITQLRRGFGSCAADRRYIVVYQAKTYPVRTNQCPSPDAVHVRCAGSYE